MCAYAVYDLVLTISARISQHVLKPGLDYDCGLWTVDYGLWAMDCRLFLG